MTEADTCRKYVVPRLQAAGWDDEPHSIAEQRYFADGRIIPHGQSAKRREGKRADCLLRSTRDFPLAVVEAKAGYKKPADGLQQAKDYASILGLQFAIVEFDFKSASDRHFQPDADAFDLLCHLAFNAPLLTRRQRADRVKKQQTAFFNYFGPEAREIPNDLLEKYAADGELQFTLPDVLKVPPISEHGNVNEIVSKFGGPDQLRTAVNQLQSLLYAA